jgi:L-cysteine S-thiosulfotransferase
VRLGFIASGCVALLAACGVAPQSANPQDAPAQDILKSSFREQGIAKLDRLNQDELQRVCSAQAPPSDQVMLRLQALQLASIQWPANGVFLGDWREGEKLAQNGRGMTWSDSAGAPSGGNCYNCHQITRSEVSFGTLGPSLYQYGKLRGVTDPLAPSSQPVVSYTWGKLWNAKAYSACSNMPRFGQAGVLTQAQIRDLMALLLDPNSPVNAQ